MGATGRTRRTVPGVVREEQGRVAFQRLIEKWLKRSDWSLQVMSDLAELAVARADAPDVPAAAERSYAAGATMHYRGHVWRARRATRLVMVDGELDGPRTGRGEESGDGDWEHVLALKRLHPSQLNLIVRGRATIVGTQVFDALGLLNEFLADVRAGRVALQAEPRLVEKAAQGIVIADADGVFGPEEFLGVYLGRLEGPVSISAMSEEEAAAVSAELARQIRQGMVAAGLDLVDDWSSFVAAYPSNDRDRLAKIKDVAFARSFWSPEEVEDERAAVAIALRKLSRSAAARSTSEG
jgi:hypothetical protein